MHKSKIIEDIFVFCFVVFVFVFSAWMVSGCDIIHRVKPCEVLQNCDELTETPTPTNQQSGLTSTPTIAAIVTMTPTPPRSIKMDTITRGVIKIVLKGLYRLLLSKNLDNLALFSLVAERDGEPLDRSKPIIEVAARGNNVTPCLIPLHCDDGDTMGLEVTFSANLLYEDQGHAGACGHGTNYHRRLALGNISNDFEGSVEIKIEFDASRIKISTPVDFAAWSIPVESSLEFSRIVQGSPWKQGPKKGQRSWLWDHFSAAQYGTVAEVTEWDGERGLIATCP